MHFAVGILDFLYVSWTKISNLVEPLAVGTRSWSSLFRHFKVFRLHARLHDAAGAVWALSGKGLGYYYMIGRGPNSCLLGHLTGFLF